MPDLELRRRVAELRGWTDTCITTLGDADGVTGRPEPWQEAGQIVPFWDCDLADAGDLWAEIPALIGVSNSSKGIEEGPDETTAFAGGTPYGTRHLITVATKEVPGPKERLARAITLLWVAWKEAQG